MSTLVIEKSTLSASGVQRAPSKPESGKVRGEITDPAADDGQVVVEIIFKRSKYIRPVHIMLGQLFNPELKLIQPIPADVSEEAGIIVANWAKTGEFGYGPTLSDALSDLARASEELFFELEDASSLSSDLLETRGILQQYISRARP